MTTFTKLVTIITKQKMGGRGWGGELTVFPARLAVSTVAGLLAAVEATLKFLTTHKLTHMLRVLQRKYIIESS